MSVQVPVNPQVLRWARESVSVSLDEAAARLKLEVDVIREWDNGDDLPSLGPLRELAYFYRRPMAAFLLREVPKDHPAPADYRVTRNGSRYALTRKTRYALNVAFERRTLAAELARAEDETLVDGRRILDDARTPFDVAAREARQALSIGIDKQRSWKNPNQALNA